MRIKRLDEERPGVGTLLIADEETGIAVVIDPCDEISAYLMSAKQRGLRLAHVFATHVPDEACRQSLQLWKKLGISVHASARLPRNLGFQPLMEGSSMRFGSLKLQFYHVAGSSPDALTIHLYEIHRDAVRRLGVVTRYCPRVA